MTGVYDGYRHRKLNLPLLRYHLIHPAQPIPIMTQRRSSTMLEEETPRAYKRQKIQGIRQPNEDQDINHDLVRRHPLGVRPAGNVFAATVNAKAFAGLFAMLPEELLSQLFDFLHASDLLHLGGTCRALHAHTRNDELWRALFIEYDCP